MKNYNKLTDALNELHGEGYKEEFPADTFCLYCSDLDLRLNPNFHVDESIRVDDAAHPAAAATVYAISSCTGVKGTLVEAVKNGTADDVTKDEAGPAGNVG